MAEYAYYLRSERPYWQPQALAVPVVHRALPEAGNAVCGTSLAGASRLEGRPAGGLAVECELGCFAAR